MTKATSENPAITELVELWKKICCYFSFHKLVQKKHEKTGLNLYGQSICVQCGGSLWGVYTPNQLSLKEYLSVFGENSVDTESAFFRFNKYLSQKQAE